MTTVFVPVHDAEKPPIVARIVRPDRRPANRHELAKMLAWMLTHADAVYMPPAWRLSMVARAAKAAALAGGLRVIGYT